MIRTETRFGKQKAKRYSAGSCSSLCERQHRRAGGCGRVRPQRAICASSAAAVPESVPPGFRICGFSAGFLGVFRTRRGHTVRTINRVGRRPLRVPTFRCGLIRKGAPRARRSGPVRHRLHRFLHHLAAKSSIFPAVFGGVLFLPRPIPPSRPDTDHSPPRSRARPTAARQFWLLRRFPGSLLRPVDYQ